MSRLIPEDLLPRRAGAAPSTGVHRGMHGYNESRRCWRDSGHWTVRAERLVRLDGNGQAGAGALSSLRCAMCERTGSILERRLSWTWAEHSIRRSSWLALRLAGRMRRWSWRSSATRLPICLCRFGGRNCWSSSTARAMLLGQWSASSLTIRDRQMFGAPDQRGGIPSPSVPLPCTGCTGPAAAGGRCG